MIFYQSTLGYVLFAFYDLDFFVEMKLRVQGVLQIHCYENCDSSEALLQKSIKVICKQLSQIRQSNRYYKKLSPDLIES